MNEQIAKARVKKRKRYIELATIANEVCDLLEKKGVTHREGCTVRRIAEDMWNGSQDISVSNVTCDQPEIACDRGY